MNKVSSGGIVVFKNAVLLLQKFNDDWVLPKGGQKKFESLKDTALREVFEETGSRGQVVDYVGKIHYKYRDIDNRLIDKVVHWYHMKTDNMECRPQREEGFKDANFVHIDRVMELLKHDDERSIFKKFLEKYDRE